MQNEIKVEVQGEPGANIQFGKDSSYRAPATVNKTYLKIGGGVFLSVVVVALLMGPPEEPITPSQNPKLDSLNDLQVTTNSTQTLETFEEEYKKPNPQSGSKKRSNFLAGPEALEKSEKVFFEPGTTIEAQIVTGGSMGFVKAKLKRDLPNTPLKAGTILIGKAEYTNDRIQVGFTKAVVGNRKAFGISAYAASPDDKEAGIAVSLWEKYGKKFGLTAGLYMVSGIAQGLQNKEEVGNQVVVKPSLENAALEGVKTSSMETATDILNDQKSKEYKPNLKTELPILVVFDGEISPAQ